MEEYIKLLELPDEFDLNILKKAYRKKVMQFHPDKAPNEAKRANYEAIMKKLNEANDYLKEYLENHNGQYVKEPKTSYNSKTTSNNSHKQSDDTDKKSSQYSDYEYKNQTTDDSFEEQEIIYKGFASYFMMNNNVLSGTLYILPNALFFETSEFCKEQLTKTIYFDDIYDIQKEEITGALKIFDSDGLYDKFAVNFTSIWIRLLYITLIKGGYSSARESKAFVNMNRQYDNSLNPDKELEYFIDVPKWMEDWGWIKEFARWCVDLKNKNYSVIFDILKGIIKLLFRIIFIPVLLATIVETCALVYLNLSYDYFFALQVTFIIFSMLPNKVLFKKSTMLLLLIIILFFTHHYAIEPKSSLPENNNLINSKNEQKKQNSNPSNHDVLSAENAPVSSDGEKSLKDKEEVQNYMNDVQAQIKSNWVVPNEVYALGMEHIKITVAFSVLEDGSLAGEPLIKKSSGIKVADESCIEAIKKASPFKPLPDAVDDYYLNMEFTFEVLKH